MLIACGLLLLGVVLLVVGADWLVKGAVAIASRAGVSPAVVGLTIVAAGTSTPELVVSVSSALKGSSGLAIGNVVGSNIFNIAAILGLCALVRPLSVPADSVRLEWPVMMLTSVLMYLLSRDGSLDALEGVFFLVLMVSFTGYMVWASRRSSAISEVGQHVSAEETAAPVPTMIAGIGWTVLGVAVLVGGAEALVRGAVELARGAGISETIIGLTVVAAGTSLPELATSLVASYRGKDDIAITNVIGSNIFNILFILGVTGAIAPLPVSAEILDRDTLWMMFTAALLLPLMRTGMRITRGEGAFLLAVFLGYLWVLAQAAMAGAS